MVCYDELRGGLYSDRRGGEGSEMGKSGSINNWGGELNLWGGFDYNGSLSDKDDVYCELKWEYEYGD